MLSIIMIYKLILCTRIDKGNSSIPSKSRQSLTSKCMQVKAYFLNLSEFKIEKLNQTAKKHVYLLLLFLWFDF